MDFFRHKEVLCVVDVEFLCISRIIIGKTVLLHFPSIRLAFCVPKTGKEVNLGAP